MTAFRFSPLLLCLLAACVPHPVLRVQVASVSARGIADKDIVVKARLRYSGRQPRQFVWKKQAESLPAGWEPPSVCTPDGCMGPGFTEGRFSLRNRRWHEVYLTFYPEGKPGKAVSGLVIYPADEPGRTISITYAASADQVARP